VVLIDQPTRITEREYDPAPGVDIVMPVPAGTSARLLDGRTLKLIGVLHRRFLARRRELFSSRAQAGTNVDGPISQSEAAQASLADLTGDAAASWEGRVGQLEVVSSFVQTRSGDSTPVVAIRGWEQTEPGVLVDGRAVPGCIFDLAVAMSVSADEFRREHDPFSVSIPMPLDDDEAQLWVDLGDFAHDRAGIDRGTIRISPRQT